MRKFTTEELGQMGEAELQRRALKEGLVANRVARDLRGYDFVLEFDALGKGAAFDLDPPTRRVFIQVKASQKKRPTARIKLSNWKYMVLDPSPWFVLFVQIDSNGDTSEVCLRHVDEHLQARALKALRGAKGELHDSTLELSGGNAHRLRAGDLRTRLEAAVGSWDTYSSRKSTFTNTVGYERDATLLNVTFAVGDSNQHIRDWVDAALGLPVKLPAERVVITDNRFSMPVKLREFGPAVLEMSPQGAQCTVQITPVDGDIRTAVTLQGRAYSTAVNPHIPAEHARARFACGPLDLFVNLQPKSEDDERVSLTMSTSWDSKRLVSLDEISRAASSLLLMGQGATTLAVSFNDPEKDSRAFEGRLSQVSMSNDSRVDLGILSRCLCIAQYVDVSAIQFTSGEIVKNLLAWGLLGFLISGNAFDLGMRLRLTNSAPDDHTSEAAVVMCPKVQVGNSDAIVVGAFTGSYQSLDDGIAVAVTGTRVAAMHWSAIDRRKLVVEIDELVAKLDAEGFFVVRPDHLPGDYC